jgi:hypothetical protein
MYDETNVPGPEYRVRPVVRYVVTRYCHPYQTAGGGAGCTGGSEVVAEAPNEQQAEDIAKAMQAAEDLEVQAMKADIGGLRGPR